MNVYDSFIWNSQQLKTDQTFLNGWMTKETGIHILEYYSVLTRNGLLIYATIGMNLQGIAMSEKSQSKKVSYHLYDFIIQHSWNDRIIQIEENLVVARDHGQDREWCGRYSEEGDWVWLKKGNLGILVMLKIFCVFVYASTCQWTFGLFPVLGYDD